MKKQAYKTWGNHLVDFDTDIPDAANLEDLTPSTNNANIYPFYRRVRNTMITK